MTTKLPRGIRNNNPGNIKELPGDKTQWVGERASDDDPVFEEFETMEDGIRALMKILKSYMLRYNLRTVSTIIKRFAPHNENYTERYIKVVSDITGYGKNEILSFSELTVSKLVNAICYYENGGFYITEVQIKTAWGRIREEQ